MSRKKVRKMLSLLVAVIMVCLSMAVMGPVPVLAAGTTYYVDPVGGLDTNNGTSTGTPWKTMSKLNGRTFAAGDSILFKGGTTISGEFDIDDSGTSGSPITIGSYGTGRATVNAGNGNGIHWVNSAYIVVKDLVIYGSGVSTNRGSGVRIENNLGNNNRKTYVRVDNVTAYNFGFNAASPGNGDCFNGNGIYVGGNHASQKSGFSDVQITNCTAYNNQWCGIAVSGAWQSNPSTYCNTNVIIRNCVTYDNEGNSAYTGNWSGSGIFVNDTDTGTIERCVSYSNGANNPAGAPGGPYGIWLHSSKNVTIQYNESYDNTSAGADGGAWDFDAGCINCTLQYNYSHNNKAGLLIYVYPDAPWYNDNLTARYNIFENDGNTGAYAQVHLMNDGTTDTITNVHIYNNTFYQNSTANREIIYHRGASNVYNVYYRNNIFYSAGAKLLDIVGDNGRVYFQGNNYYSSGTFTISDDGSNYSSLSGWRTATSQEKNGSTNTGYSVNPQLTSPGNGGTIGNAYNLGNLSAYMLQSTSPMINAGLNLNSLFGVNPGSMDFYGNSIPYNTSYDIGAHEYSGGGGTITNLVTNPGFESNVGQDPDYWFTWSGNSGEDANYSEAYDPHGGSNHVSHYKDTTAYNVYTAQTITGLTNGYYTMKAWVKCSGGFTIAQMEAKDFGGTQVAVAIPTTSTYQQITLSNINVTNGQCTIGFWTDTGTTNSYEWIQVDDVEFYKQ